MGNFSRDPADELRRAREKGYAGLRVEQGVPVLDRDLNLLADLVAGTVREILERHLGDGVAEESEAFAVEAVPDANDFRILAPEGGGGCLVGGIRAEIHRPLRYTHQEAVPELTTPRSSDRDDLVYLDVWVEEVDASADPDLSNETDVGVQTSVRLRPEWCVRVAEGAHRVPEPAAGHAHCPLALLERPRGEERIRTPMLTDVRRTGLRLEDLVRRVERLEAALQLSSNGSGSARFVTNGRRRSGSGGDEPARGIPRERAEPAASGRERRP